MPHPFRGIAVVARFVERKDALGVDELARAGGSGRFALGGEGEVPAGVMLLCDRRGYAAMCCCLVTVVPHVRAAALEGVRKNPYTSSHGQHYHLASNNAATTATPKRPMAKIPTKRLGSLMLHSTSSPFGEH